MSYHCMSSVLVLDELIDIQDNQFCTMHKVRDGLKSVFNPERCLGFVGLKPGLEYGM